MSKPDFLTKTRVVMCKPDNKGVDLVLRNLLIDDFIYLTVSGSLEDVKVGEIVRLELHIENEDE